MLELRVLGQFDVLLNGEHVGVSSRSAQSLLAYLAMTAGIAHRREKLAGLLWPEADDENARSYLRHALWRIRKAIETDRQDVPYILADELSVAFNPRSAFWLDSAVLERATANATPTPDLVRDTGVYRGELLPGFVDEWVGPERDRIEAVFQRGMQRLAERLSAEQRWPEVVEVADRWITLGHSPEAGFRALMVAHAELGDRARLAATYDRCRRALFEELGVEPSIQTRALYERLATGETERSLEPPELVLQAHTEERAPSPGAPPYRGLEAFAETDVDVFFGRELAAAQLLGRLSHDHLLAVVGASGSGKSSVVRAGLVPAWRDRMRSTNSYSKGDTVFVLTPTARPLESLATCVTWGAGSTSDTARLVEELERGPRGLRLHLRRSSPPGGRVLLVVDQLEELFSVCHDAFEREAFLDNVLAAADASIDLVLALRADFYANCAQHPALRDALAQHQEYLGSMSADELRRAIEGPAHAAGWDLEDGLVDMLLRDVGDEPGALPLLSHALLETWRRREVRTLSIRGYAASGGVRSAIARTAESVYTQKLSPEQQCIGRRVFIQLTELGEGTQDTRRRMRLDELVQRPEDRAPLREVLSALAEARLITLDQETADVSHEALIREWPRLRGWLQEDRAWLINHRQLAEATTDWLRLGRDADALYRGTRLALALDWREEHAADLSPLELEFIEAARALAEREAAEREMQRQRELQSERRSAARLRTRAFYLGAAFLLALAMAGAALFFGEQAQRNASTAQAAARAATSRELAAAAVTNLPTDPERSMLLALEAVSTTREIDGSWTVEAEDALHQAILNSRALATVNPHSGSVVAVAFDPGGKRVASANQDGSATTWDVETHRELFTFTGDHHQLNGIDFSPDGARFATSNAAGIVRLWDATTGVQLGEVRGAAGVLYRIRFSPDGQAFATGDDAGVARIWDASSGAEIAALPADTHGVSDVTFSADGTRLATAGDDGWARVWELTPPREVLAIRGTPAAVRAGWWQVAFSPDGAQLAVVDYREAYVWDIASGRELYRLTGHTNDVLEVAFSPDGTRLATAGLDRRILIWDVRTGRQLFALAGHTGIINSIAFAPDGNRLVSGSADGTVRLWDLGPARELVALPGPPPSSGRVTFSTDGRRVLGTLADGTTPVWDASSGEQLLSLRASEVDKADAVAASPDGKMFATTGQEGLVRLWDAHSGQLLRSFSATPNRILGVAFAPDSRRLATASGQLVQVWDLAQAEHDPLVLAGHTNEAVDVAFSPDGRWLLSGSWDRTARLWDAETGAEVRQFNGHTDSVWGVRFSPNGTRMATASRDGTARVWDVASGRSLSQLSGHTSTVVVATFSPDGRRIATASRDGTARLWDAATGGELLTLHGSNGGLNGVAFSPDGRRLVTGGDLGLRVYALPIDDLVELARSRLTRTWMPDECRRFLRLDRCPPAVLAVGPFGASPPSE